MKIIIVWHISLYISFVSILRLVYGKPSVALEKCPKFIHNTHAIHFAETCFLFLLINPTTSLLSRIIIMVMYVHILGPDFNILTKI